MRLRAALIAMTLAASGGARAAAPDIAPSGTLRAAYILANQAQAVQDPQTGAIRGVVADIARELGRRTGVPVAIRPIATAAGVLAAVQQGDADIGFVAPNPERMGVVLYSQTYMLVQQSFLVRADSPIRSVGELDRTGNTIGVNTGDSIAVYLKGHFTQAMIRESSDFALSEGAAWLADGTVAAFGGNRQRLRASTAGIAGLRLLPDNLYAVPQAIAVAKDRPAALAALNEAIDALRQSGFLQQAVERSGVDGISVAPASRP